jgi:hypothetical protein
MMVTRTTKDDLSLSRVRLAARPNHRFKFEKRRQLSSAPRDETLSVVAICVKTVVS